MFLWVLFYAEYILLSLMPALQFTI
jgi:hypothetical protein